jgi:hypothetical protein
MIDDTDLKIGAVLHRRSSPSTSTTEAAAATAVGMQATSMPYTDVTVDRPSLRHPRRRAPTPLFGRWPTVIPEPCRGVPRVGTPVDSTGGDRAA